MGRCLLSLEAFIKEEPVLLLTSHLESGPESSTIRVSQFSEIIKIMSSQTERVVVFAGDTNLREKEVNYTTLSSSNIVDVWMKTGSQESTKATWDLQTNTNHKMGDTPLQQQPKARYDRMLIRNPSPPLPSSSSVPSTPFSTQTISSFFAPVPKEAVNALAVPPATSQQNEQTEQPLQPDKDTQSKTFPLKKWVPVHFQLLGTKKVETIELFPSDHYGICCDFRLE